MKQVNCPGCNKKLGEIDEENCFITYEKGVEVKEPNAFMDTIFATFKCPGCGKTLMQTFEVKIKKINWWGG